MAELVSGDPVQVGGYRLLGRLGEGGMGVVYLGTAEDGGQVAVKVIAKELAADPEFRTRFAREVAAPHMGPHTAQVIDADTDAAAPWMASTYIPGTPLEYFIAANGPLSAGRVLRLGAALAEGLKTIHSCGFVHRDLKPSNIIMADDGPRIIDFGIARSVNAHVKLTETGHVIGTAWYMSPEHINGGVVPASDVFSLGSVLTYAATGHGPFDMPDADPTVIMYRVQFNLPDLGTVGEPLRGVLTACLAKNPGERPGLDDLATRLAAFAAEEATRSAAAERRPPPTVPQEKTPTVLVPADARPKHTPAVPAKLKEQPQPADRQEAIEVASTTPTATLDRPIRRWLQQGKQPPAIGDQGTVAEVTSIAEVASVTVEEVEDPVRRLAFSPDGRLLAGLTRRCIYLWDVTPDGLAEAPITGPPLFAGRAGDHSDRDLRFSPDGRFLACGPFTSSRRDAPSEIWGLVDRQIVDLEPSHAMRRCVANALSPNGDLFAVISLTGIRGANWWSDRRHHYLYLWDLKTRQLVGEPATLPGEGPRFFDGLFFTPDSRLLVSYGQRDVIVQETAGGSRRHKIRIQKEARSLFVSASSDGRLLGIGTYADVVLLKKREIQ
jgi:serine/threonine protein kinase